MYVFMKHQNCLMIETHVFIIIFTFSSVFVITPRIYFVVYCPIHFNNDYFVI